LGRKSALTTKIAKDTKGSENYYFGLRALRVLRGEHFQRGKICMQLKYGFISVDDHVQEVPNLWIDRLKKKFGDRVPHLATTKDGSEQWFLDGQLLLDGRTARAGH
jgi:hypothetical protein